MITCPQCHQCLSDEARFCGNCAAPLVPEAERTAPFEEDPFVGKCVDNKYFIVKRIASGGMGVVYLARQKGVGQEVAIKKLHPELYRDKKIVERFIDEARSYAKITHPNAVKLHDLLNIDGQICLVMEFVHGRTLTDYIERGYIFSIRQIIDISLQFADAIATAHQAGIIHRDLKTENVILLETVLGRFSVKILDFGIAKIMDKPSNHDTQEGIIVGTPEFMSPEQCYGRPVDHRVDIYAFGILVYVMICGKLPFVCDTALGMLQLQISEPVPPLVRPDHSEIPAGLVSLVLKCMEKSASDRYQTFADVIADLMYIQERRSLDIAESTKSGESKALCASGADDEERINAAGSRSSAPGQDLDSGIEEMRPRGESGAKSRVTGFDISDELPVFSLSIDGEDDEPDEEGGDGDDMMFDEHGAFSLGDIRALDDSSGISYTEKKSNAGRIVVIVVILLAIAGGIFAFQTGMIAMPQMSDVREKPSLPQSFESSAELVAVSDRTQEPVEAEAPAVPEEKPAEPEPGPVPASAVASRDNISRGVLRAVLKNADRRLNDGDLAKAGELIEFASARRGVLDENDARALESVAAKNALFGDIAEKIKKASGRHYCKEIVDLLESVPVEASGMRDFVAQKASSCEKSAGEPPPTL